MEIDYMPTGIRIMYILYFRIPMSTKDYNKLKELDVDLSMHQAVRTKPMKLVLNKILKGEIEW